MGKNLIGKTINVGEIQQVQSEQGSFNSYIAEKRAKLSAHSGLNCRHINFTHLHHGSKSTFSHIAALGKGRR